MYTDTKMKVCIARGHQRRAPGVRCKAGQCAGRCDSGEDNLMTEVLLALGFGFG
jgi:hypothetical protein